jgi:hypothetical protein
VTYLWAALAALAVYMLVIVPWRHRREDSTDLQRRLRAMREPVAPSPRPDVRTKPSELAPEGESVESVLSESEARALLGDEDEPHLDDEEEPPAPDWPTQARHRRDLEPVIVLRTGDLGLATMFLLRLQSEGIAYHEANQVWANREIYVPRMHQNDARRILEELRRDAERPWPND